LIRWGGQRLISIFIAISIFFTLIYVFQAISALIIGFTDLSLVISFVVAILATILLYRYPEWYVIDGLGILIAGGIAAIFGNSLAILPVIVLLILLAIYDAISVYRTKHMITLAEGVLQTRAPILFVIPKRADYSFTREGISMKDQEHGAERGAFIMGMGDLIMPTILVVSANVFLRPETGGLITIPAIGAIVGSLAGLAVLLFYVNRGKPQAGLPPLNSGTIGGFLVGCAIVGAWAWVPFV
ncbi:MAG TPA: presenilin family intramembrane aspartyl protease PSH, partial [Methanomicrobiales archaeon]|nr:presenilin family intramembrane aspartyl protease PSH [Methanomicrobiales archaeon]